MEWSLETVNNFLAWSVSHPREFGIFVLLVHPVWLTILVALLLLWLAVRLKLWRRHKRALILGFSVAIALYGLDALIALPRISYARRTLDHPVIHRTTELPARLVLVNASCGGECHARLLAGELEEVILIETDPLHRRTPKPPRRYRAGWTRPGACPPEREKAMPFEVRQLLREGFCPVIELAETPSEGVFVVDEGFTLVASEKAIPFTPIYLADGPPGKLIELQAVEVQLRTHAGVEVLAAQRYYEAPGLIGLPPLIGCWERPDNIVWILPAGDTGCGLWRWFNWGGDPRWGGKVDWIYADVFTRPARTVTPVRRPQFPPPD
jgi:hypothetical protein